VNPADLAERVEQRLITETEAAVAEEAVLSEKALDDDNSLFTKIRFSWRKEDAAILNRIRVLSKIEFEDDYKYAINEIDHFYLQLRVPEQRNGIVQTGADQRPVWKTNETTGQPIEDWGQLTGQQIEETLLSLARLRMEIAPRVNELWLEAIYARDVAKDIFDDAFDKARGEENTIPGRTAGANIDARADKYAAYFRFYLYSVANTFLKEINAFVKLLENIRYWQVRTQS
jgi:hypothetical protein